MHGQKGAHIGGNLRGTRLECDEQWFGYTYVGTVIDLTVVLPLLAVDMQWEILPSPLSSDHFPILITSGVNQAGTTCRMVIITRKEGGRRSLQTQYGNEYLKAWGMILINELKNYITF